MTLPTRANVNLDPPKADLEAVVTNVHGVELSDPYAWLRDAKWQDVMRDPGKLSPRIRDYLEAENAYTKAAMAGTEALQDRLFEEMKARIKQDDSTVPARHGPWAYFSRFVTGGQYAQLCRQPREGGDISVLLDGNAEAEGKAYWSLGGSDHSRDHRLLAYGVDDKGSEYYEVRIRDLETGEDLADVIPDTNGNMVWANDSKTLFYVRIDQNHRPRSVYRHKLGTSASDDVLVYEEATTTFYVSLGQTQSAKFIVVTAHDHETSEVYLVDADDPTGTPRLIAARETGHEYGVEHNGERLFITTNSGDTEDFQIVEAPVSAPQRENWKPFIGHRAGRLILDVVAYRGHLIRLERENGLPRIVVRRLTDNAEHEISFDEEAYSLGMSHGLEFDTQTLRFSYSSMTTPAAVYDYDLETRKRVLRKQQEVPSGHNPEDYVTRRLLAPARDGETVPVSLIYRKDTPLDGSAPVLLYGYGSYGISIPASFATARLSLVDRGFIYAIAHIRGGKEKGYRWYKDGKREAKRNTFTDFIAAGEHLVAEGLTRRGNIVAQGGSAGGMLMGAVANMAPELFGGIIANVAFVDVLNTILDADLPLTPPEWTEWGNPITSADDFHLIRSYSPYDNVKAQAYPHILAVAGLTDPRVTYWEPAKWIARLRALDTSDHLILLKTNMDSGHGGASGRFESLKETALEYSFALMITGRAAAEPKTV
ncbi:MAG: S9 family peptidase [Alphaproteobacteria bacterium]|nr:S9 family peptidase [Alphaproteobacteria bacterium]